MARPGPGVTWGHRYASQMRIAVGPDHARYRLQGVSERSLGAWPRPAGARHPRRETVETPESGAPVGGALSDGRAELGVWAGGTGSGLARAAPKIVGVRAARVHDVSAARPARVGNHANVVCPGRPIVGDEAPRMPSIPSRQPNGWVDATRSGSKREPDSRRAEALRQMMGRR